MQLFPVRFAAFVFRQGVYKNYALWQFMLRKFTVQLLQKAGFIQPAANYKHRQQIFAAAFFRKRRRILHAVTVKQRTSTFKPELNAVNVIHIVAAP